MLISRLDLVLPTLCHRGLTRTEVIHRQSDERQNLAMNEKETRHMVWIASERRRASMYGSLLAAGSQPTAHATG